MSLVMSAVIKSFEPAREIMALFVLHKFILQMGMRSHPVGLDVLYLVRPFIYFHTSCVRTGKALARLRKCAGLSEPLLVAYVINTIVSWAGSFDLSLLWVWALLGSHVSETSRTLLAELGKQNRPRSHCSFRSSLIRVYTVCHSICIY